MDFRGLGEMEEVDDVRDEEWCFPCCNFSLIQSDLIEGDGTPGQRAVNKWHSLYFGTMPTPYNRNTIVSGKWLLAS